MALFSLCLFWGVKIVLRPYFLPLRHKTPTFFVSFSINDNKPRVVNIVRHIKPADSKNEKFSDPFADLPDFIKSCNDTKLAVEGKHRLHITTSGRKIASVRIPFCDEN